MNTDAKAKDLNVKEQEKIKDKETSKQAIAFIVAEIDEAQEQERNSVIPKLQVELSKAYHDDFLLEYTKYKFLVGFVFLALSIVNFVDLNVFTKSVLESDLMKSLFFIGFSVVFFQHYSNRGYVTQILPNTKQKTRFEIDRITYVLWGKFEQFKTKTFSIFTSVLLLVLIGAYFLANSFIYDVIARLVGFIIVVFYVFSFKTIFIKTQNKGK